MLIFNITEWRATQSQIATFSQFQVYSSVTQAKQISSLLLNHFYPVTSYRRVRKGKKTDELLYTIRSLVKVRESVASARG